MGIEPTLIAWEAIVLPLYDICVCSSLIYGQNRNLCFRFCAIWTKCVFYWQPRQDSNLRIYGSKPYALTAWRLGYKYGGDAEIRTQFL